MLRDGVTIYFVRHGQTDWNARGLAQGQSDIPLNAHGREQARGNGQRLAGLLAARDGGGPAEALDFVASPLGRARETMEIVRAELGLPAAGYRLDERLTEMGFGVSEGVSWPGYVDQLFARQRAHGTEPWSWAAEGGESYAAVSARALPVFREAERDTVVVCHGGISRCLLVAMGGIGPDEAIRTFIPQDRIKVLRGTTLSWM